MPRASSRSSCSASRSSALALPARARAGTESSCAPDEPQLDAPAPPAAAEPRRAGCAPVGAARRRRPRRCAPATRRASRARRRWRAPGRPARRRRTGVARSPSRSRGSWAESDQRAPHPARHAHGRGHRRAVAPRAQALRQLAADALVALDALHPPLRRTRTSTVSPSSGTVEPTGRPSPSSVQPPTIVALSVFLVAHDPGAGHPEQPPDLLGHLREQRRGGASAATEVAIRRSADCSSASMRVSRSLATSRSSAARRALMSLSARHRCRRWPAGVVHRARAGRHPHRCAVRPGIRATIAGIRRIAP